MFYLDIDTREHEILKLIYDFNGERLCTLRNPQLTTSDFAAWYEDQLKIIAERKTWNDLSASIIDGRLDRQLEKMAAVQQSEPGCAVIFIIEGVPARRHGILKFKDLMKRLDHIMMSGRAHIIYTLDPTATVKRLYQLIDNIDLRTCTGGATRPTILFEKHVEPGRPAIDAMSAIPGVSLLTARAFLDNKMSIMDVYNTGDNNPEPLSRLKYDSGVTIGTKRANKIQHSLSTKKCWIKILSAIAGVSKTKAEIIIAKYPDPLDWTVDDLSDVLVTEKRRLGTVVAQRIIDLLNFTT